MKISLKMIALALILMTSLSLRPLNVKAESVVLPDCTPGVADCNTPSDPITRPICDVDVSSCTHADPIDSHHPDQPKESLPCPNNAMCVKPHAPLVPEPIIPATPDTNPANPPVNNNGGSSHSGGGSIILGTTTVVVSQNSTSTPATSTCPYLNSYLRFGDKNDSSEVTKLQIFLKNYEKSNVDTNGNFDQKTLDAVKEFQSKYVGDTMAPWGVTTPTGHVFYTTKKKINEIVCKSPLSLTSEQMEQIEAYKKAINTPKVIIESQATGTTPITPEVGLNSKNNQIASLGNTSFTNKILHPIKWMFGN